MKINGPGESALLLLDTINVLNKLSIRYAIVGAFAASFHGLVRASLDADAVISLGANDEKLSVLISFLKKRGLKVDLRRGDLRDPIRCVVNIRDKFQNRVDLLMGLRGMHDDAFDRAVSVSFMKASIKVVGIEDFVAMKLFAGSARDIQDAVGALEISAKKVNFPLLRQLTHNYGKSALSRLEKILGE